MYFKVPQLTKEKKRGYTIIELSVVFVIIVLLSGMALVYNRAGEQHLVVFQEQVRLQNLIYRAKSYSITTVNSANVCGYGIHFTDSNHYYFYRSTVVNCKQSPDPSSGGAVLERHAIDSRLRITPLNIRDILFVPPDPKTVLLAPGGSPITEVTIHISSVDGIANAIISLNDFGQISL